MKITKQRLKEIIKEELGNTFEMSADELINLGQSSLRQMDKNLLGFQSAIARLVEQHDGGEFVNLKTHANMIQDKLDELRLEWTQKIGPFADRL
jgi:hypothetical protein